MIPQYRGFKSEKATSFAPLPAGGYVAKIINAKIEEYSWGSVLVIAFDVAEGDYTGFFAKQFGENTSVDRKWKGTYRITIPDESSEYFDSQKRGFNNLVFSLEDANSGYHFDWNEKTLKNLYLGVLFRKKEWEWNGKIGWTTECCSCVSANEIRSGNFKIPKDKPLPKQSFSQAESGFNSVADDDDLPF